MNHYSSLRFPFRNATDKARLRPARKIAVSDRLSPVSGSLAESAFSEAFPRTCET